MLCASKPSWALRSWSIKAAVLSLMRVESRKALIPLAMSRAAAIEVVMPLIADQSIFMSALSGVGCVGATSIAQGRADTLSHFSLNKTSKKEA